MSQTITQLKKGGSTAIDITSDGYTDVIVLTTAYSTFAITFAFSSSDADPKLSFEGSNDNTTWTNMYSIVEDLSAGSVTPVKVLMTKAFSNTSSGVNSVKGDNIPFKYFRIAIDPNGATTGTMTAVLNTEIEQG